MRRQREQEDYWDEHEDYGLDSSSDESDCDELSLDSLSSDDEREVVIEEGGKEEGTCEGLGDDEGGVLLDDNKRILKPVWKKDAGGYLRGVRGCGSPATENREIRRKKELEKSASQTRSIVDMFLAQQNKKQSPSQLTSSVPTPSPPLFKKVETKFELRVQAAHDLGELLRLNTQQIEKYGQELSPKSSYLRRHQMMRSFLWMQLNKEKDNPHLNRRQLAQVVAQSFNKRSYTGRRIVQWERSWVKDRVIPNTKEGNQKGDLSWMDDEDLVLSIKDWAKKEGESKFS